jgi:Ca2+-binding EF-hand superfamily protein
LIQIFVDNNKLEEFTRMIRSIDADHNGFITWHEAEDMLKMLYPEQLQNKSMKKMFRPFCSAANRVLLDYKQLKGFIKNGLKGIYTDINKKENLHIKQQQALNITNLMNPT